METALNPALKIGNVSLATPILLAPMAGYTDLPFRLCIRQLGGLGLAFTAMLSPQSILLGRGKRRCELLATTPEDRPLGHQIYGNDPRSMSDAARWLQDQGAILLDINMGCPQHGISAAGAGAGLLRRPSDAVRLAEEVVSAVSIPVTAKLRLGWDSQSWVAAELARDLEKAGIAAVTIHGRTREQGYTGEADLEGIRWVVEAVERIPVIGNGDIRSPSDAQRMFRETGCSGIMVGRGATSNPWLIRDIWRELSGLPPLPPPTLHEQWKLLAEQFERSLLHYGQCHGVVLFRRWIAERAGELGLGREAMIRLLNVDGISEMRRELAGAPSSSTD